MAKNLDTTADATGATACECSKYEAFIPEQHTEENLANGNYDTFSTGCVATTKREFAPGHDAKLKSFLIQHGAQSHEIRYGAVVSTAEDFAKRYTFGYMILEGIAKAKEKLAAKAERAAKKAAKPAKAERKLAEKAKVVAPAKPLAEVVAEEEAKHAAEVAASRPEPEWDDEETATRKPVSDGDDEALNARAREERERDEVTAKVGRWEYKGIITDEGGFRYRNKGGNLITAPKGTYKLV
ncbi:hypothetical protein SEA_GALACTICA_106 [Streptomyces phage Galactica]|nr:hypothetical protein SEA_GALACTICA_106 [Streptomyces phage Galactica]